MSLTHLKVTQAGLVALLTTTVGQLIAFVPSLASDKQILISAGSSLISAAFLGANALHHVADSNVSARDVEQGAINAARSEVSKVDFNSLVQEAVDTKSIPDLEAKVRTEVQKALSGLLGQLATSSPAPVPAFVQQAPPAVSGNIAQTPPEAQNTTVTPQA